MFGIKLQSFPNREVRATLYKVSSPRLKTEDDDSAPNLSLRQNSKRGDSDGEQLELSGKKAGYGRLGRQSKFSTYARRQMMRAGAVFDLQCPKNQCLFLTGTLPGSTDESFRAIAEWSSYIVNCLKAWIAKRVKAKYDMYCWEWQKRGALHLHYVVHVPCRRHRRFIRSQFKKEWIRLLDSVSRLSGVDLYRKNKGFTHKRNKKVVRATAEIVQKSVASYMAKYLSKNANNMKGFQARRRYFPARWYGCSRPLLARLKALTSEETLYFARRGDAEAQFGEIAGALESNCTYTYRYQARKAYGHVTISYHDARDWGNVVDHALINWLVNLKKMNNQRSYRPLAERAFERVYDYMQKARNGETVARFLSNWGNPWHLDLRCGTSVVDEESVQIEIVEKFYLTLCEIEDAGYKLPVEQLAIKRWYEGIRDQLAHLYVHHSRSAAPDVSPADVAHSQLGFDLRRLYSA